MCIGKLKSHTKVRDCNNAKTHLIKRLRKIVEITMLLLNFSKTQISMDLRSRLKDRREADGRKS
jgi:hypothetical protein